MERSEPLERGKPNAENATAAHCYNGKLLLMKKDAATLLGCSIKTIERLVSAGRLTPIRLLGGVRIPVAQVVAIANGVKI